MDKQFEQLLSRTPLNISFNSFLKKLQTFYPQLGEILAVEPIFQGYEDANIKLKTTGGTFVLKIFSRRKRQFILDYARVLTEAKGLGVPVPELVRGTEGTLSIITGEQDIEIPCWLSIFFDGHNFEGRTPTLAETKEVAGYLARLNTLRFSVSEDYDSWGNRNFLAEYERHTPQLNKEQLTALGPIVREMKLVDYSNFEYGVIHGDMQRKHVLQNTKNDYCIIDFGCMAYAPIVFDVSILFAWFCLTPDTWLQRGMIAETVIGEYKKLHMLSDVEVATIPTLTRAAYAAYYQKTALLIAGGDYSGETKAWHDNAETMLNLTKDWVL